MTTFTYPNEVTIYEVQNIHTELITFLKDIETIQCDLSQVEEMDSAGIQLVLWMKQYCSKAGISIESYSLSEVVERRFARLNINLESVEKC